MRPWGTCLLIYLECALFMRDCCPLKLLVQQRRTHIDKVAQSVESSESCPEPPLPPPSFNSVQSV